MRILFEIAGDRQIDRELTRVGGRAGDASPAFRQVAYLWLQETREQFDTEGEHGSGGWKPLKNATLARNDGRGCGRRSSAQPTICSTR